MGQMRVSDLHDRGRSISAPSFRLQYPLLEQVHLLPQLLVLVGTVLKDRLDALLDKRKLCARIRVNCLLICLRAGAVASNLDVNRKVLV